MTSKAPLLYKEKVETLIQAIQEELAPSGWQGQQDGAGWALVQLFGHLAQVVIHRLNQVPQQHFRAFLNEAGIDRLPPRAASTELTFTPAPDAPAISHVPQGTQVVTRSSETQAEIVFETEREITVVPATLAACISVNSLNFGDHTRAANGQDGAAFAAFEGESERDRILFIGHDTLFTLPDESSRQHARFTLHFAFEPPAVLDDFWHLQLLYCKGEELLDLAQAGAIVTGDVTLHRDGNIYLTRLPVLTPTVVNNVETVWLACKLTGGRSRQYLPVLHGIQISREIVCPLDQPVPVPVNAAFAGIQSGTVFAPLDLTGPVSPLGLHPGVLDALYLQIDEAFTKPGATVKLAFDIEGVPTEVEDATEFDALKIQWEYFSTAGWTALGASVRACPILAARKFDVERFGKPVLKTNPLTRRKYLEFAIPRDCLDEEVRMAFYDGTVVTDIYTGNKYVTIPMPDACAGLPQEVLVNGGSLAEQPTFTDTTCALTTPGSVEFRVPDMLTVRKSAIPAANPPLAPLFAMTEINGEVGCWIRARIAAGSYDVPQKASRSLLSSLRLTTRPWLPPVSYAPVLRSMQVTYRAYSDRVVAQPVNRCLSMTDKRLRDHAPDLREGTPFQPFTTTVEEPALYLGFSHLNGSIATPAFPGGHWIEMRIGVQEREGESLRARSVIAWEYWNGYSWENLHPKDGTLGLLRTGYLGFYAPRDHQCSEEFGQSAYWLRALPADAATTPMLEILSLNTVQAVNADTVCGEVLGSSDGEPAQHFTLARPPILSDIQLEVREPAERGNTPEAQAAAGPSAANPATASECPALPSPSANEVWMPWQPVATFNACGPDSRCYILDSTSGEIHFGDGKRGKIPPPGSDNICVKRYRTHQSAAGNVAQDTVTVLRNPKGELGQVRSVTNLGLAVGGSAAEEVAQTEERGPYSIKSGQRAVTYEDFAWLAREVTGVARAQCLPVRDPQGMLKPGWVTVVITPQPTHALPASAETKPVPTPALLRQVRQYLLEHALANLGYFDYAASAGPVNGQQVDEDQIAVKGPTYLEVTTRAKVVVGSPEQSDSIRLAIIQRLKEFLHPLNGGPERTGWEPGRDVYVSEVAAEIEQVPGVDHVASVSLQGTSRPQQWLGLRMGSLNLKLRAAMPAGSQVSTCDEQIKLILAKTLAQADVAGNDVPLQLPVYGFNVGDTVNIAEHKRLAPPLAQRSVADVASSAFALTFHDPLDFPDATSFKKWWQSPPVLIPNNLPIRLPIEQYAIATTDTGQVMLIGVTVRSFLEGTQPRIALHGFDDEEPLNLVASNQPTPDCRQVQIDRVAVAGYTLMFDKPVEYPDLVAFQDTQQRLALVMSSDQRVRLPIERHHTSSDTSGKVSLLGVTARSLAANDYLSLTHPDRRANQLNLGSVLEVTSAVEHTYVYVPADHLVCSGNHDIEMVLGG